MLYAKINDGEVVYVGILSDGNLYKTSDHYKNKHGWFKVKESIIPEIDNDFEYLSKTISYEEVHNDELKSIEVILTYDKKEHSLKFVKELKKERILNDYLSKTTGAFDTKIEIDPFYILNEGLSSELKIDTLIVQCGIDSLLSLDNGLKAASLSVAADNTFSPFIKDYHGHLIPVDLDTFSSVVSKLSIYYNQLQYKKWILTEELNKINSIEELKKFKINW